MNKKDIVKALSEEFVSGEKITKKAQKVSKTENDDYYKEVEKKMTDYDKNLKQDDKDKIDPPKRNHEGSEKEYHEDMEIMNGQEMLNYANEPSDMFKDRAKKAIEGDSTMGNKTYTGKENGNTEPVWGASDADFGKKLVDRIKSSKKKRDDATGTFNQFGDDIEMSDKKPQVSKKKVAVESMKRIKFKKPFNGVANAIKLIPEAFKVDRKTFELTDGNEKYKVKWEGTLNEGRAVILEAGDKNLLNEDMNKIKHLMGYKSEDTIGTPDAKQRVIENKRLMENAIGVGFANAKSGFENEDLNPFGIEMDKDEQGEMGQQIDELSPELKDRAYKEMRRKGMYDRPNRLQHGDLGLDKYKGQHLDFCDAIIGGMRNFGESGTLNIEVMFEEGGSTIISYEKMDDALYYDGSDISSLDISRKDARLLGTIVTKFNPNSKYGQGGASGFQIQGY